MSRDEIFRWGRRGKRDWKQLTATATTTGGGTTTTAAGDISTTGRSRCSSMSGCDSFVTMITGGALCGQHEAS